MIKRLFDILAAFLGLFVVLPLLLLAALLIKLDSSGPVFFRQERMGRGFRPFLIYKFRTMKHSASASGRQITVGKDPRITRVGRLLRKTKIDELPQLINVLKGDMSFVGPRPEVRKYVNLFRQDYIELLSVRPGITDLASLKYRDEGAVLTAAADPDQEYVTRILPDKIKLGKEYVKRSSLCFDTWVIGKTLGKLLSMGRDQKLTNLTSTGGYK
jgi:lipopolysaccharide/colanic/teichoic acid biosynthesis glycosyltransferase